MLKAYKNLNRLTDQESFLYAHENTDKRSNTISAIWKKSRHNLLAQKLDYATEKVDKRSIKLLEKQNQ